MQETRPWQKYIKKQDWGIICVDFFYDEYKITDEKKWFINKIKYGF